MYLSRYINMSQKWNELKKEKFESHPMCKLCRIRPAAHYHHAVINKGKVRNKKLHKYLDVEENGLEVCEECHKGADAYDMRVVAWGINCARYGYDHMRKWYDDLPLLVKEEMP